MDSIPTATERQQVQANAAVHVASQSYLDAIAAADAAFLAEVESNTANAIIEWCTCADPTERNALDTEFTIGVQQIGSAVLAQWESDLTSKGYVTDGNSAPGFLTISLS